MGARRLLLEKYSIRFHRGRFTWMPMKLFWFLSLFLSRFFSSARLATT